MTKKHGGSIDKGYWLVKVGGLRKNTLCLLEQSHDYA